jgi:carbamoyltransferase
VKDKEWEKLFGFARRESETNLQPEHCDFALAAQIVTEEIVILMAKEAKRLTGSDNICLAGGVALNCVANGKLQNAKIFKNVYIQPAAGDAGGALGAALVGEYIYFGQERKVDTNAIDSMKGSYLGPEFSDVDTRLMAKRYNAVYTYYENFEQLAAKTATALADGNVVGWFQGRMEFGPRALGGRSILGDARNEEMQKKLNLKIKYLDPSLLRFWRKMQLNILN